jgi:molybdopterin/thiamine biosynthesis adenylyltransferase/rhodanese-related sulfurtransferase
MVEHGCISEKAIENTRYLRQISLPEIGVQGQARLARASVLVVGAGGLGCPVLLYLAAAGVGRLAIVDPDHVDESNLHRQILYTLADVGMPKVDAAARRVQAINPDCTVEPIQQWLDPRLATDLVSQFDVVVDGTDNFSAKYILSDVCLTQQRPLLSASVQGFAGYIGCFCAGAPSYRAVFPETPEQAPTCGEAGVLGTAPGLLGLLQANEVIKLILGIGESLRGRILRVDLLTLQISAFSFAQAPEPKQVTPLTVPMVTTVPPDYFLLDVREPELFQQTGLPGACNIPLEQLAERSGELPHDQPILVYCQMGIKSENACRLLQKKGFSQVTNLAGGLTGLANRNAN